MTEALRQSKSEPEVDAFFAEHASDIETFRTTFGDDITKVRIGTGFGIHIAYKRPEDMFLFTDAARDAVRIGSADAQVFFRRLAHVPKTTNFAPHEAERAYRQLTRLELRKAHM